MDAAQDAHYTIYTFGKTEDRRAGRNWGAEQSAQWQKHESVREKDEALRIARDLFDSGHFQRIEVKSRHFDKRANRMTDMTLKIFGPDKTLRLGLPAVAVFAGLCGLAAFFLTGMIH